MSLLGGAAEGSLGLVLSCRRRRRDALKEGSSRFSGEKARYVHSGWDVDVETRLARHRAVFEDIVE